MGFVSWRSWICLHTFKRRPDERMPCISFNTSSRSSGCLLPSTHTHTHTHTNTQTHKHTHTHTHTPRHHRPLDREHEQTAYIDKLSTHGRTHVYLQKRDKKPAKETQLSHIFAVQFRQVNKTVWYIYVLHPQSRSCQRPLCGAGSGGGGGGGPC